ncbi:MAG: FtsW/RodA/SpoVE family cell cycle protein, partial [Candidatus Pelagibacterales bacterium]
MNKPDNKNELTIISNWWFNIDKQLLFCFLILSFFGLAVSFTIKPGGSYVDQVSLINAFTIQSVYLFAGVFIFLFLSFLDLKKLRKLTPLILIFLLIIFTLTIIPGFGIERKGSARWLDLI